MLLEVAAREIAARPFAREFFKMEAKFGKFEFTHIFGKFTHILNNMFSSRYRESFFLLISDIVYYAYFTASLVWLK